jgi:hypothetical protein
MVGCENSVNPINSDTHNLSLAKSDGEAMSLAKKGDCVSLKDGTLLYTTSYFLGDMPIPIGYDEYGYNYQARMFNGSYFNNAANKNGYPPWKGDDVAYLADNPDAESYKLWAYREIKLSMKWSDTWLSNMDCNGDGKLDRGYACDPVLASSSACQGSWLTNHMSGRDILGNGKEYKWTYFTKMITPPNDAYKVPTNANGSTIRGIWYTADGVEIGSVIWNAYAKIHVVSNDKYYDERGLIYKSLESSGLGYYNP